MEPDWAHVFHMYFLLKNGDIPASYASLPEGSPWKVTYGYRKGLSSNHHFSGASC